MAVGGGRHFDRVLFLDTDQIYPPDYYVKMLEHNEPVVSALNTTRYYPYDLCVFNVKDEQKVIDEEGNEVGIPLFSAMQSEEIMTIEKDCFMCDMTGTGALMIDPSILEKIKTPYFKDVFSREGRRLLCDDFYFGYKLFKAGYRVLIDTRVVPGHISKVVAKPYNAPDLRRAWEKVNYSAGYAKDGLEPKVTIK